MKGFTVLLVGSLLLAMPLVGCGKKGSVDTSGLESSFKSAEPTTRSDVHKAAADIKAGDYSEALAKLQRVATKAKLTPEQQRAIKDTMAAVQKQMAQMAQKAAAEAQKAGENLKKSLPVK